MNGYYHIPIIYETTKSKYGRIYSSAFSNQCFDIVENEKMALRWMYKHHV